MDREQNPFEQSLEELQAKFGFGETPAEIFDRMTALLETYEMFNLRMLRELRYNILSVKAYYVRMSEAGFSGFTQDEIDTFTEKIDQVNAIEGRIAEYERSLDSWEILERIPRQEDKEELEKLLGSETYDEELLEEIFVILQDTDPVSVTDRIGNILFQLQQYQTLRVQSKEMFAPAIPVHFQFTKYRHITYPAQEHDASQPGGEGLFTVARAVERPVHLNNRQCPIVRVVSFDRMRGIYSGMYRKQHNPRLPILTGSAYMPYIYEAHRSYLHPFGESVEDRNRLRLYQRAVELGYVAGAAVELSGPLDKAFLEWVLGQSVGDYGAVPDVEIIYSFPLPSGGFFRSPVKFSKESGADLRFENYDTDNAADRAVIMKFRKLFLQRDKKYLIEVLSHADLMQAFSGVPAQSLKDYGSFEASLITQLHRVSERAMESHRQDLFDRYDNEFFGYTQITEDLLRPILLSHQATLGPESHRFQNFSPEEREMIVHAACARIMHTVAREEVRLSPDKKDSLEEARKQREQLGYVRRLPLHGYYLSVKAVLLDTIRAYKPAKKRIANKPLDIYEDSGQAFSGSDRLHTYLSDHRLDRRYREMTVYDPSAKTDKQYTTEKAIDEGKARKLVYSIAAQNCKRAEHFIKRANAEIEDYKKKNTHTDEERKKIHAYMGVLDTYGKSEYLLEQFRSEITRLQQEKE